jgi:prephenate dehydrogenase
MRIAILGAGKMGKWFSKFFLEEGYLVVVADRKKEKTEKLKTELSIQAAADFAEAAKSADWILICVSIKATAAVVKKISPVLHQGQIVMDIASMKQEPLKIMHEQIKNATILGTHPVFGPGSGGVEHKAFILTPTNPAEEKFAAIFKNWLEERKARVFIMTPEKHDELMSVVLGFTHFLGLVACDTLIEQPNYPETKTVAGTTYRMLFTLAESAALESPELFATLQLNLPNVKKIENEFMQKAQEWLNIINRKDQAAIVSKLEELKARLAKISSDYEKSYETMYKMLEATENSNPQ